MSDTPATTADRALPTYTQSLLKIRVPILVTLAAKKQSVAQVLELGPGSILAFDKPCEDLLSLQAGGHPIAVGEAVKVGDRFGLRIKSIVLPEERFKPIPKAQPSGATG